MKTKTTYKLVSFVDDKETRVFTFEKEATEAIDALPKSAGYTLFLVQEAVIESRKST